MSEMFEKIKEGLEEAIQYEKGNHRLARTRKLRIEPLPMFSADEVRNIRNNLNMSQSIFATVLGVSKKTIEAWEAGTNTPNGSAKRVLQIISNDKKIVDEIVHIE